MYKIHQAAFGVYYQYHLARLSRVVAFFPKCWKLMEGQLWFAFLKRIVAYWLAYNILSNRSASQDSRSIMVEHFEKAIDALTYSYSFNFFIIRSGRKFLEFVQLLSSVCVFFYNFEGSNMNTCQNWFPSIGSRHITSQVFDLETPKFLVETNRVANKGKYTHY